MRFRAAALALLALASPGVRAQDPVPEERPPLPAAQAPAPQPEATPPAPDPTAAPGATAAPQGPPAAPPGAPGAIQGPPAPPAPIGSGASGERPLVRAIEVEGEQRYSEAQLISAFGHPLGVPLDLELTDRGTRTLWASYHVRAEVRMREQVSAEGARELVLVLIVAEAPSDRQPRFEGNVAFDDDELRKWALIEDRVELFEYQAARVRQRILEGYHSEGYYWAEVEIRKRETAGDLPGDAPLTDLVFEIREGPRVRVKRIQVVGNRSMPESGRWFWRQGIRKFAGTQLSAPWEFNWFGNKFVMETLEADVIAMRNVYRERGWLDAQVTYELDWNEDGSEVRITYLIDEGEPYIVESVSIEYFEWVSDGKQPNPSWTTRPATGEPRFAPALLLEKCQLKPGMRYEEVEQARDEARLREFYGEQGHLAHDSLPRDMRWEFLEPELFANPQEHKLQVIYRVVEAHPLTLREIAFAGNQHTRDEVLRSKVGVFPGEQANLKEINRGLSRIEGLQFFTNPQSPETHLDPTYRFLPVEGSKDIVDLEYMVEEGRVVEFNLMGGYDTTNGAFGLISLTMRNFDITDMPSKWNRSLTELLRKEAFHGAGQRIDLELSPGTRVSRYRVHFNEPDLFDRYLEPISLDIDLRKTLRGYRTHDEDRSEKQLRFGRAFGFDTFFSVGLTHVDLDMSDVDNGAPASVVQQEQIGQTVLVGMTLDASTRRLDNLIAPHNGWKVASRNVVYTDALGSEFEFLRADVQFDGYLATGKKADGTEHVLHFELDGGVMPTFGDTDAVPYTERYFTGGPSSLRGFAYREAGARGIDVLGAPTRFPAGGESVLYGTVEWLYPLTSITQPGSYRKIEVLRGLVFFDWGVLGETAGDIDLDDMRASAGFGVGLAHPIPIQLNFGFPLRSDSGDRRQTFSFSVGLSF